MRHEEDETADEAAEDAPCEPSRWRRFWHRWIVADDETSRELDEAEQRYLGRG